MFFLFLFQVSEKHVDVDCTQIIPYFIQGKGSIEQILFHLGEISNIYLARISNYFKSMKVPKLEYATIHRR